MFKTTDVDLAAFLSCIGIRYTACIKAEPSENKPSLAEFHFDDNDAWWLSEDFYSGAPVSALAFARKRRRLFALAKQVAAGGN